MNITDLFASLSYGELSNLAMSVDASGVIRVQDQPKILNAANEALLLLHSKFILSAKDIWIEARKHITYYHFDIRFAESNILNSSENDFYIKDLRGEPFTGDVIKVLNVFDQFEYDLPLNDVEHTRSVFTPQPRMLQIPDPVDFALYNVVYQAKHPTLILSEELDQEIDLPDVLHSALKAYIAYRVHSNMNTQEATAKAAEHLQNYIGICQNAVEYDLVNTSNHTTNVKFNRNGWI
jgi:hypothetical protein